MTTPVDLDHLERLHAAAVRHPSSFRLRSICNALPALIAEVRALRDVRDAVLGYAEIRHSPGEDEVFADVLTALAKVPR
jgi:hypothetical protein